MMKSPARLTSVEGPLGQAVFALDAEECVLGRDRDVQICLPDRAISRRHTLIRREESGFRIIDLDSRNGVSINGVKVRDSLLRDGDRVDICAFRFVFSLDEEPQIEPTIAIPRDSLMLIEPPGSRVLFQMRALFAAPDRTEFDRLLVELAMSFIPARSGGVAMAGEEFPDSIRAVVTSVLRDRAALSIPGIIAAPILAWDLERAGLADEGPALGVLYLERDSSASAFDQESLELLAAIALNASSALEHRRAFEWLQDEKSRLEQESGMLCGMIGGSPPMRDLFDLVRRAAATDASVVISGETGAGKELVARAIHQLSRRASRPFIALNCAAIPETLLESELFGHERGAFTGALAQRRGKLEMAEGGVLFLDEIGEMSPVLQAKLLRVLQEREFERIGGTRTIRLNARVVTATNRDLAAEVRAGRFREDLFFRLNVLSVRTPALRERKADILSLAQHFLRQIASESGREVAGFSPRAQRLLLRYDWPGNVRELRNAVERAVAIGTTAVLRPEDLGLAESAAAEPAESGRLHAAVVEAKRGAVTAALAESDGSVRGAAQLLGVNPRYLHRLMNQLGLSH